MRGRKGSYSAMKTLHMHNTHPMHTVFVKTSHLGQNRETFLVWICFGLGTGMLRYIILLKYIYYCVLRCRSIKREHSFHAAMQSNCNHTPALKFICTGSTDSGRNHCNVGVGRKANTWGICGRCVRALSLYWTHFVCESPVVFVCGISSSIFQRCDVWKFYWRPSGSSTRVREWRFTLSRYVGQ